MKFHIESHIALSFVCCGDTGLTSRLPPVPVFFVRGFNFGNLDFECFSKSQIPSNPAGFFPVLLLVYDVYFSEKNRLARGDRHFKVACVQPPTLRKKKKNRRGASVIYR